MPLLFLYWVGLKSLKKLLFKACRKVPYKRQTSAENKGLGGYRFTLGIPGYLPDGTVEKPRIARRNVPRGNSRSPTKVPT